MSDGLGELAGAAVVQEADVGVNAPEFIAQLGVGRCLPSQLLEDLLGAVEQPKGVGRPAEAGVPVAELQGHRGDLAAGTRPDLGESLEQSQGPLDRAPDPFDILLRFVSAPEVRVRVGEVVEIVLSTGIGPVERLEQS